MLTFQDVPSGASKSESPLQVFRRTIVNVFEPRLMVWLLIMSCFWLMMYQLWDLHPNFITDWVDSSDMAAMLAHLPFAAIGLVAIVALAVFGQMAKKWGDMNA